MNEYTQISPYVFNCDVCPTRCDGASKMVYNFEDDVAFSEHYEQQLIDYINNTGKFLAQKTADDAYPDIKVTHKNSNSSFYIEVKVQRRTFMSIEKKLPDAKLKPSETVALNLSDLLRYDELKKTKGIEIFILWVLLDRPCITGGETKYYYRLISELMLIFEANSESRRFTRESGDGDIVDGIHKGVTVNYHFSLTELKPWEKRD
ncbi:hypothetical protein VRU48_03345 [Pedobacter sp. KR3-3]|uniref:Uncharacterized protein n=1 Tax=Pedobacter albus TaxID=3113905 RepID=A0ABU7I3T9_9SPHI|nr:hypothetical protein [Pedobacter sp. KR3-3]MEE1944128.1 hypothetical protein [Pedobacter sp. KR3-3]